jgi:hypothetical protein
MGWDRLPVKPSAKPTLVRTQHLPPERARLRAGGTYGTGCSPRLVTEALAAGLHSDAAVLAPPGGIRAGCWGPGDDFPVAVMHLLLIVGCSPSWPGGFALELPGFPALIRLRSGTDRHEETGRTAAVAETVIRWLGCFAVGGSCCQPGYAITLPASGRS